MSVLTDRASILRAFYRLCNTDAADDSLTEHDDSSTTLEGAYQLLQQGLEDAQLFMIDCGFEERWLATTASAISFTGSDPDRYYDLPDGTGADAAFLRLYGTDDVSGLRQADGTRWGRSAELKMRFRLTGNYYYFRGDRIYLAKSASPPSDLYMDYIYRLPVMADSTTVDFPEADRRLIPAFAARHAMEESWFPGGPEMEQKIMRNLKFTKNETYRRARRTQQPKMVTVKNTVGDHWFI